MHPTMAGSEGFLEEVSALGSGEYGLIILQSSWDYLLRISWNITDSNTRQIIRKLKATGAVVVFWEDTPLWDRDSQITTTKDWCDIWNPRGFACGVLDDETQTATYYEEWGTSLFQQICEEEGALFIPQTAFHDSINQNTPAKTIIHPELMDTDGRHLNGKGYIVVAERFARYLVDWGLAEYAESQEEISQEVLALFSNATNIITKMKQQGIHNENLTNLDDLAQLLYENQYLYTARWELVNEVIPLLEDSLSSWPEVSTMFTNTSRLIDLATSNTTMDTSSLLRDYGYAEKAWGKLDHAIAKYYLQRILDRETEIMNEVKEPSLLPTISFLGLILLLTHQRRRWTQA